MIADTVDYRLRVVAGELRDLLRHGHDDRRVYTIAGNGEQRSTGDGGPATSGDLYQPQGVTVDGSSNEVIADTGDYRIRVVAGSTGTSTAWP